MNTAALVVTVLDRDDPGIAPGSIALPSVDSNFYGTDTSQAGGEE
jgi:hypothetical protein